MNSNDNADEIYEVTLRKTKEAYVAYVQASLRAIASRDAAYQIAYAEFRDAIQRASAELDLATGMALDAHFHMTREK